jgi:hypothetical protein
MDWFETDSAGWMIDCWFCNGWVKTGSSSKQVGLGWILLKMGWNKLILFGFPWILTHGLVLGPQPFSSHIYIPPYTTASLDQAIRVREDVDGTRGPPPP